MKMSVFRQGSPLTLIDHIDLLKLAADKEAAEMIMHARMTGMTMLIGLSHGQSVVKHHEARDEAISFEELYDTAISPSEYRKMEKQNVKSLDELAPHLYEMEILLIQEAPVRIRLRVKCKDQYEVKAMVKRLVREDTQFGTELYAKLAIALMETDRGSIEAGGPLRILDAAPDDAPDWEFIDRSGE